MSEPVLQKMYFKGYMTSGKNGLTFTDCATGNGLKVGKQYLVEEYTYWASRNGNGGSSYSTCETAFRVYDPKTKKILSTNEWWSVFSKTKTCKKHDLAYISDETKVKQCSNCFKKFRDRLVEV